MKKQLLISTIILPLMIGTVSAKVVTENEIGPCISRNAYGFCVESKTHYCSYISKSNGRCTSWYDKRKSEYDNALEHYNSYMKSINGAVTNSKSTSTKSTTTKTNSSKSTSSKTTSSTNNTHLKTIQTAEQQRLKEIEAANAKAIAAEKSTIPNSVKLSESLKEIDKKIQVLQAKQAAGVDVTSELELYSYKSHKLWQLNNLRNQYATTLDNLQRGILSQSEFDEIMDRLRKEDIEIATPYQQIMAITYDSMEKEKAEIKAQKELEEKKERKKQIGKKLVEQGTLYVPPSACNMIRHGVNALELFK